ncbi:hypothetical protein LTR05_008286 [Lithohypha guttulata]|uniref:Uncharacterized protein n=1 Tax=Lithohypha guttulata TaxID=1690604 RepID=A0AAN7Y8F4_9EURO|nr:hypothetical protein LTR05_008286 [Lithohypha guttulata]
MAAKNTKRRSADCNKARANTYDPKSRRMAYNIIPSTKAAIESTQHADASSEPAQNHKRKRLISRGKWKAHEEECRPRKRLISRGELKACLALKRRAQEESSEDDEEESSEDDEEESSEEEQVEKKMTMVRKTEQEPWEDEDEDTSEEDEEDEEDDDLTEDEGSLPVKYKVDTIDFATKVYDIQPRRKTIPVWESLRYRHHIDLPNDERVFVDDIIRVGLEGFAKILEIRYDREEGGCLVLIQWLYDKDDIIDLLRSRGRLHLYAVTEGVGRHRILPSDHFQVIDQDDISETADLRGKRVTVSWYFTCAWEGMEEWVRSHKFQKALDKQLDDSRRRRLIRSALEPPNYFN